jgi:hypothetical protein
MRFHAISNLPRFIRYGLYIAACATASGCGGDGLAQSGPSMAAAYAAAPLSVAPLETNATTTPVAEIATVLPLEARATSYRDPLPLSNTERDTSVPAASSVRFREGGAGEPVIETF